MQQINNLEEFYQLLNTTPHKNVFNVWYLTFIDYQSIFIVRPDNNLPDIRAIVNDEVVLGHLRKMEVQYQWNEKTIEQLIKSPIFRDLKIKDMFEDDVR